MGHTGFQKKTPHQGGRRGRRCGAATAWRAYHGALKRRRSAQSASTSCGTSGLTRRALCDLGRAGAGLRLRGAHKTGGLWGCRADKRCGSRRGGSPRTAEAAGARAAAAARPPAARWAAAGAATPAQSRCCTCRAGAAAGYAQSSQSQTASVTQGCTTGAMLHPSCPLLRQWRLVAGRPARSRASRRARRPPEWQGQGRVSTHRSMAVPWSSAQLKHLTLKPAHRRAHMGSTCAGRAGARGRVGLVRTETWPCCAAARGRSSRR